MEKLVENFSVQRKEKKKKKIISCTFSYLMVSFKIGKYTTINLIFERYLKIS